MDRRISTAEPSVLLERVSTAGGGVLVVSLGRSAVVPALNRAAAVVTGASHCTVITGAGPTPWLGASAFGGMAPPPLSDTELVDIAVSRVRDQVDRLRDLIEVDWIVTRGPVEVASLRALRERDHALMLIGARDTWWNARRVARLQRRVGESCPSEVVLVR